MEIEKKQLTREGFENLCKELEDLKVNKRKIVALKLKEAREQGDLSENAEYDAAREEQGLIESKITEIEGLLKSCEILESENIDKSVVHLGCKVLVEDLMEKETLELQLVGTAEVNSLSGKISDESPIGKVLIGHKEGEIIDVISPLGKSKLKIIKILETL